MKNKEDEQKTIPWLEKEQKIGLSNVFVGFTIAGGLALLSYVFSESSISDPDALIVALGTMLAIVLLLWLRKE